MSIYEIVKALQKASGNLEKQAILLANKDNALFKAYMKAVYDVSISYYATKLPTDVTPGNLATLDQEYLDWLVKAVAERVFVGNKGKELLKITLATFDAEGGELFRYIIDRSIGANVGDTMVLDTWPGLYFIPPYMRCASMSEKAREAFGAAEYFYVQTKRDGSFAYMQRSYEGGRVVTRQGSVYPNWFWNRMTEGLPYGMVLMGELEVFKDGKLLPRKEGNGVLNSLLQSPDRLGGGKSGKERITDFDDYEFRYVAWDTVCATEFADGKSERPYELRWLELESTVTWMCDNGYTQVRLSDNHKVTSVAKAKELHVARTAAGLEGTVWKTPSGLWKNTSSGTNDMVKVKVVAEAEFVVTGYYEGKGKAKGMLGGLTISTSCGKMVCNMGSGFNDRQRKEIWDAILNDVTPVGWIVTAEFNDISSARGKTTVSLSLPIFIERRFDRTKADSLERVYEQFEAAKEGRSL